MRFIKNIVPDVLAVVGGVCISYGAFLIYAPIGYITFGAVCILGAYIWTKGGGDD